MKISYLIPALILLASASGFSEEKVTKAVAVIYPTEGNSVQGKVTFTVSSEGTHIVADVEGLKPGEHGFHIHEYGDCSSPEGMSAGGHYNPTNKKHGCLTDREHHVGDLGNIRADEKGHGHLDVTSKEIKLSGEHSVIGRSIVVHSDKDDCVSQPAGNSGKRLGCGVIGISK